MKLTERLEKLLECEDLQRLALDWKEGEGRDIRESYLYLAGEAHRRLKEKIANWLKNEGRFDHKIFDKEFLGPLYIRQEGSEPRKAWDKLARIKKKSKGEWIEMTEVFEFEIVNGNPSWKLKMSLLTSPKKRGIKRVKGGEILRQLWDEEKDELAREFLEVFEEETDVGEKYKKIDKLCKDAIEKAKREGKRGQEVGMGPSRFTSILHAFKPEEYIHIDEIFLRALDWVGGRKLGVDKGLVGNLNEPAGFAKNYPILNDFAKKLVERLELQNLCDLYWFLIAIDENIICDKF